jgi:hypothetical protein
VNEPAPLKYQTALFVAGQPFHCIESYDAVHARLRDAAFKATEDGLQFGEPVELTVGVTFAPTDEKRLVRAAFAPAAISALYEIPADLANEAP